MRSIVLVTLFAACSGSSDAPLTDAAVSTDGAATDAKLIDARPMPDAPPAEVCSGGGWCQAMNPPSYAWALSVAPDGQPWTVAYGVRTKTAGGWVFHDIWWDDFVDPFIIHDELYAVHALSSTDVWVGGTQGYAGHFDGSSWTEHRPAAPDPEAIWGAASNDVWLLYDSGLRYHWNGTALEAKPTSQVRYRGAWGTSANDVWGYGETVINNLYYPAIDHFDGTTWTRTVLPGSGTVFGFWSSGPTDLYALITLNGTTRLLHGDGTTWSAPVGPSGMQILDVWGRAANDVWVVGKQGAIGHYDGTTWTLSASGTSKHLNAIRGTATVLWATGDGVALHKP